MRTIAVCCAIALMGSIGCQRDEPEYPESGSGYCRDSAGRVVRRTARTAAEGVEGGVETGWAGVKQTGKATGGLVTGGTEGAEREWNEGKVETRQEAREMRQEIDEARLPDC
jgi:hypothetical protein